MKKLILTHKKNLLAFAVGMVAAALSAGVHDVQADANADLLTNVFHSHGCIKITGSNGNIVVFGNGIKNTNINSTLQMACALISPAGGFEADVDQAGADLFDNSTVAVTGIASMKSCFTARKVFGTGCTALVSTAVATTGVFTLLANIDNVDVDPGASRYIDVTLPAQHGSNASVIRGYGYQNVNP
jgi:hypothetical protein